MKQFNRVTPIVMGNKNCIVFASNSFFLPYMSVMIRTVIDHSCSDRIYDILVLHRDIKIDQMTRIEEMAADHSNVYIRFCNILPLVGKMKFYVGGKDDFSVDAYSRLLIPSVLSEDYEKALYLDGDMVAKTDVMELLDTDLTGYFLASSRDLEGISQYYMPGNACRAYRDSIFSEENPDNYFISGMLVLNLGEIRKEFTQKYILDLATSREWLQHDQDVLNMLCKGGRAKLLHASWDVLKPMAPEFLPRQLRKEQEESVAHPKIIHYGGNEKPWKSLSSPWMNDFWDAALRTPFCKEIVYRILKEHPGNINDKMLYRYETGQVGFQYIFKFIKGWMRYKRKVIKKKLFKWS